MIKILTAFTVFFIPFTGVLTVANGISTALFSAPFLILISSLKYINRRILSFVFYTLTFYTYGLFLILINSMFYEWTWHIIIMPTILFAIFYFLSIHGSTKYFEKVLRITFFVVITFGCFEFLVANYFGVNLISLYVSDTNYQPIGHFGLIRARSVFPESGHFSLFIIFYMLYKLKGGSNLSHLEQLFGSVGVILSGSSAGMVCLFLFFTYFGIRKGRKFNSGLFFISFFGSLLVIPFLLAALVDETIRKINSISFLERLNSSAEYYGVMKDFDFITGLAPGFYHQYPYEPPIGIIQIIYFSYGLVGLSVYLGFLLKRMWIRQDILLSLLSILVVTFCHLTYGGYYYFFAWLPFFANKNCSPKSSFVRVFEKEKPE